MGKKPIYALLLLLLFSPLRAQETGQDSQDDIRAMAEKKYGLTADLINGEKYYYPYWADSGDPFFPSGENNTASIVIRGKVFENRELRYDICNQIIVLDYTEMSGASASIALRNEWVDQFLLGDKLFMKYLNEDGQEQFAQLIYEGRVSCVYFWEKLYSPDLKNGEMHYKFSDPIRNAAIIRTGETRPFRSKKSFLKCFPKEQQAGIKSYLREKGVKFKKADDGQMKDLLEFINQAS